MLNLPIDIRHTAKIVYLVRDPREIVNSRISGTSEFLWDREKDFGKMKEVCNDWIKFIEYRDHYDENILIIRYEDFVYQPILFARKVYKFVGLSIHTEVKKYLELVKKKKRSDLGKWKHGLKWSEIERVQKGCSGVMSVFGYKEVFEENVFEDKSKFEKVQTIENLGCLDCKY